LLDFDMVLGAYCCDPAKPTPAFIFALSSSMGDGFHESTVTRMV